MTENTRNVAIGLTVLIGLCMLVVLVLAFTGLPQLFQTGYTIKMHFEQTHDIVPGDPIYLRGKRVGLVQDVEFTDDDPRKGVTITAKVRSDVRLPGNIQARVFTKGLVGKGYLSLIPDGPLPVDPKTGKMKEFYSTDEIIVLQGIHDPGSRLLPPELIDAMKSFGKLAENLNELLDPTSLPSPTTDSQPSSGPAAEPPRGLKGTIFRLNRTLDALYAIAGNPENQANLQASLENFADASAKASQAMDALKEFLAKGQETLTGADELTRKLITDAEDISALLGAVRESVEKINKGDGTVGKLLNDPKLYNNLIKITEQMEALVKDFRRLADKWERKGVEIKLK